MLASLKRWFSSQPAGPDLSGVADWAQRRGHHYKRSRDGDGFVIDGQLEGKPWRLEWGRPQRAYIEGRELRMRIELALLSDMQMLLLSRPLLEQLERQTYEQFTESTQTQIGTTTPEEMRWLVMFPKVNLAALPSIRAGFGAVASVPAAGLAWIEGPLANSLERAREGLLKDAPPFVLMSMRNRGYLRVQLTKPTAEAVAMALELFETSVAQAIRSAGNHADPGAEWAGSASSAWQSLRPDDPADRKRR